MSDVATVLGEFVAAWSAGERPRPASYLERVAPAERDELGEQIETFLLLAPEPMYPEAAWGEMTADPGVTAIAAAAMVPEPWPSLLPRLRQRAGLTLAQVAGRLGLPAEQQRKAERLLHRMEAGRLDPRRPTRTLLQRLADVFGVAPAALDWRGSRPAAPAALYRAAGDTPPRRRLDLLAEGLLTEADAWDEVDELFLGGRE
jgi:transcriptional regulator with XRE-family HTH domain